MNRFINDILRPGRPTSSAFARHSSLQNTASQKSQGRRSRTCQTSLLQLRQSSWDPPHSPPRIPLGSLSRTRTKQWRIKEHERTKVVDIDKNTSKSLIMIVASFKDQGPWMKTCENPSNQQFADKRRIFNQKWCYFNKPYKDIHRRNKTTTVQSQVFQFLR